MMRVPVLLDALDAGPSSVNGGAPASGDVVYMPRIITRYVPPPPKPLPIPDSGIPFIPPSRQPEAPIVPETQPTSPIDSGGTHGSGPAVVESASRSIESPAASSQSTGGPQQLPPVQITGTAGQSAVPWKALIVIAVVTVAVIVAVAVFRKRG